MSRGSTRFLIFAAIIAASVSRLVVRYHRMSELMMAIAEFPRCTYEQVGGRILFGTLNNTKFVFSRIPEGQQGTFFLNETSLPHVDFQEISLSEEVEYARIDRFLIVPSRSRVDFVGELTANDSGSCQGFSFSMKPDGSFTEYNRTIRQCSKLLHYGRVPGNDADYFFSDYVNNNYTYSTENGTKIDDTHQYIGNYYRQRWLAYDEAEDAFYYSKHTDSDMYKFTHGGEGNVHFCDSNTENRTCYLSVFGRSINCMYGLFQDNATDYESDIRLFLLPVEIFPAFGRMPSPPPTTNMEESTPAWTNSASTTTTLRSTKPVKYKPYMTTSAPSKHLRRKMPRRLISSVVLAAIGIIFPAILGALFYYVYLNTP
ncbi:hypothetical protein QR680_003633 [Steinernema hermaphroditum]|uniref:Uncharacterized protein n=1 Tax=Steinernema hermaphroditum TaxID=289476 RepID=A0AA39HM13_9BILA|nr:hypothetical protein QR680_003633 [Steinernema hermaphroditum]